MQAARFRADWSCRNGSGFAVFRRDRWEASRNFNSRTELVFIEQLLREILQLHVAEFQIDRAVAVFDDHP